jgi:glycosyltransferase involved in cell wall biosynthesis
MPAYNEAGRIENTVRRAKNYVDRILVIDDASTDDTAREARKAGADVLVQETNNGYIAAIKRGFSAAETDIVVTVDADGELPVKRIPNLVQPVCTGEADMVQGYRNHIVRPSEQVLTWLASFGGPVGDSGTGLCALRTNLAQALDLHGACVCGIFSLEVLRRGGKIEEIPIRLREIEKPRSIAWQHFAQVFYVGAAFFRNWVSSWSTHEKGEVAP